MFSRSLFLSLLCVPFLCAMDGQPSIQASDFSGASSTAGARAVVQEQQASTVAAGTAPAQVVQEQAGSSSVAEVADVSPAAGAGAAAPVEQQPTVNPVEIEPVIFTLPKGRRIHLVVGRLEDQPVDGFLCHTSSTQLQLTDGTAVELARIFPRLQEECDKIPQEQCIRYDEYSGIKVRCSFGNAAIVKVPDIHGNITVICAVVPEQIDWSNERYFERAWRLALSNNATTSLWGNLKSIACVPYDGCPEGFTSIMTQCMQDLPRGALLEDLYIVIKPQAANGHVVVFSDYRALFADQVRKVEVYESEKAQKLLEREQEYESKKARERQESLEREQGYEIERARVRQESLERDLQRRRLLITGCVFAGTLGVSGAVWYFRDSIASAFAKFLKK